MLGIILTRIVFPVTAMLMAQKNLFVKSMALSVLAKITILVESVICVVQDFTVSQTATVSQ